MIALRPHAIQISHPIRFDDDPKVRVIRVIGRGNPLPEDCDAVIVDDSHGKGRGFDLTYAMDAVKRSKVPVILAGGLTPENVGEAIYRVRPYAVDVASGVEESPGIKDRKKVKAFIAACRTVP
jgi:phosphoribosylanthranilate isomerase